MNKRMDLLCTVPGGRGGTQGRRRQTAERSSASHRARNGRRPWVPRSPAAGGTGVGCMGSLPGEGGSRVEGLGQQSRGSGTVTLVFSIESQGAGDVVGLLPFSEQEPCGRPGNSPRGDQGQDREKPRRSGRGRETSTNSEPGVQLWDPQGDLGAFQFSGKQVGPNGCFPT